MVTLDQIRAGVSSYIDAEILPRLDGYKRYGLMVYIALLMQNFNSKAMDLMQLPAVAALCIMDESGRIDIDRLHDAAYQAMHDNVDVPIPIVGRFIFSRADVDKLCDMIRRA